MLRKFNTSIALFFSLLVVGCAGTHGSLKGYLYSTTKANLQNAIMKVIYNNPEITHDSAHFERIVNNITNQIDSQQVSDYYDDVTNYVTIYIKTDKGKCRFTFRYYGDEAYWKTSATSEIFICYAYNENDEGGSEGNGNISQKNLIYLTNIFEKEVISKIDKELNLGHLDD